MKASQRMEDICVHVLICAHDCVTSYIIIFEFHFTKAVPLISFV